MISSIILKARSFFQEGHERTLKAKKNIAISFVFKGISIAIGFVLIPLTINYVNPTQYGLWLILSSIIGWFSFFDIGLANGLRNKLTEAIALKETQLARVYISTTYALLACISTAIFIIFFIVNRFINWGTVLNTHNFAGNSLNNLTLIVIGIFCIQFIVQIMNTVLTANHATSVVSKISVAGQLPVLLIIYLLSRHTQGQLSTLIWVLAGVPVCVQILASLWFYRNMYRDISPQIKFIDFKYGKKLLGVGGVFFVIQIGALVLFQTDNIVITQLFEPGQVTTFNIVYKLFSAITMVFTILMTPFWSAFTEAYAKNDLEWIKQALGRLRRYWVLLSLTTIVVLIISPWLYKIWVPNNANIPFNISVAMAIYIICYMWMMLQCFFLNGLGKLRLQLYLYIVSTIVNIPIAIFLGKKIGVAGVTASNVIVLLFMGTILFMQTQKILGGKARGIWNK